MNQLNQPTQGVLPMSTIHIFSPEQLDSANKLLVQLKNNRVLALNDNLLSPTMVRHLNDIIRHVDTKIARLTRLEDEGI